MKKDSNAISSPLKNKKTFSSQVNALIDYLYIGTVQCTVKEKITKPILSSKQKFTVVKIHFNSGSPEYINDYLNTSWQYLEKSLKDMIKKDQGYYNTRTTLLECRKKCKEETDKYNFNDSYAFEAIHSLTVITDKSEFPTLWGNLIFKPEHLSQMREQCLVRQAFLKKLYDFIDSHLLELINLPELNKTPFGWNSSNSEVEITELLYALKMTGRIKIADGISEPQFREKFFNFFGLHDKDNNKRINDIKRRKNKSKFLQELSTAISDIF